MKIRDMPKLESPFVRKMVGKDYIVTDEITKGYVKELIPLYTCMKGNREGFVEGIVFTHPDGRMAKLRRDMYPWFEGRRH